MHLFATILRMRERASFYTAVIITYFDSCIHSFYRLLIWLVRFCLNVLQIVTSHCGWHALFRLTLLSFDCNFIQKIRFSILYFLTWWLCAIYIFINKIYSWFSGYVPWSFAFSILQMFVWSSFDGFFFSVFNCGLLFIYFLYLISPFVQCVYSSLHRWIRKSNCALLLLLLLFNKYPYTTLIKIVIFIEIIHYIAADGRFILFWVTTDYFHISFVRLAASV